MKVTKYENEDLEYKACIFEIETGKTSEEIMYYIHGTNAVDKDGWPMGYIQSENFEETSHNFSKMRGQMKLQPKYTIALSWGDAWALSDNENRRKGDNRQRAATFSNFILAMNDVEKKHNIVAKDKRLLLGHSLGAWNAFQIALHDDTKILFKKCGLLDPMLPLPSYKSKNPGDWAIGNIWRGGPIFLIETLLEEESYHKLNPITGNASKLNKDMIPIQLHSCMNSEWNFSPAHEEVEYIAKVNGAPLEMLSNLGRHSFFKYKELAEFLTSP